MSSDPVHASAEQPEKPYSIVLHCLALASISVAAIVIGLFLLPRSEVASAPNARGAAPIASSQPSALRPAAGAAAEPVQTHPDYFTPRDDPEEQPAKL